MGHRYTVYIGCGLLDLGLDTNYLRWSRDIGGGRIVARGGRKCFALRKDAVDK
jgi:hypothetical protein